MPRVVPARMRPPDAVRALTVAVSGNPEFTGFQVTPLSVEANTPELVPAKIRPGVVRVDRTSAPSGPDVGVHCAKRGEAGLKARAKTKAAKRERGVFMVSCPSYRNF